MVRGIAVPNHSRNTKRRIPAWNYLFVNIVVQRDLIIIHGGIMKGVVHIISIDKKHISEAIQVKKVKINILMLRKIIYQNQKYPKKQEINLEKRDYSSDTLKNQKEKLVKKLSINNKGGKCKWYVVDGQKVQGTWERNIAIKLSEMNIKWVKLKTNKDIIQYELDGVIKSYTPDFYLEEYDVYLEIKGYWWGNDKSKMIAVKEQHPEKKIKIIEKLEYTKILNGELVW